MNGIGARKAQLLAENRIRWEFGFNDPTFGGFAATGGYAAAAVLTFLAARRAAGGSFERRFWGLVCAVLVALGVNKQLDLHSLLIDWGRALAVDHGWYQQRRAIQQVLTGTALAAACAVLGALHLATRTRDRTIRLALWGLALSAGYALARAAVFNHVGQGWQGIWPIELAGIALTGWSAWRYRSSRCDQASAGIYP